MGKDDPLWRTVEGTQPSGEIHDSRPQVPRMVVNLFSGFPFAACFGLCWAVEWWAVFTLLSPSRYSRSQNVPQLIMIFTILATLTVGPILALIFVMIGLLFKCALPLRRIFCITILLVVAVFATLECLLLYTGNEQDSCIRPCVMIGLALLVVVQQTWRKRRGDVGEPKRT